MLLQNFSDSRNWTNLSDLDRLHQRLSRLLSAELAAPEPAVNVWACDDAVVVTAELPGLLADDIDLSVVNETLFMKMRRPEDSEPSARWIRRERLGGEFSRAIQLPFAVATDKVEASLSEGLLEITLPRAEADRPRRITVASA